MAGDCYVYILFREDGVTPFYVGKGRGDRWLAHEANNKPGRSHKDNVIAKMRAAGKAVPKKKVAEGLSDEEAYLLEADLIARIGRICDGGPLTNLAAGGPGNTSPSPEVREKIAEATRRTLTGRKRPPEVVERYIAAQRGVKRGPRPEAERVARAIKAKELWDPAARPDFSMAGRTHSEETKAKMRAAAIGRRMSDEARAKMSEAAKRRKFSAETLAKRSASLKAAWARRKANGAI